MQVSSAIIALSKLSEITLNILDRPNKKPSDALWLTTVPLWDAELDIVSVLVGCGVAEGVSVQENG